jgi:hypothetical protein
MRNHEGVPTEGLAEMEAIGGSVGSILAGSSLERALMGLTVGLAIGLAVHSIGRISRARRALNASEPRGHPA